MSIEDINKTIFVTGILRNEKANKHELISPLLVINKMMKGKNRARNSMIKQSNINIIKIRIILICLFFMKLMIFVTRPTMYKKPVKKGSIMKGVKRIKPLEAAVKKKKSKIKTKLKTEYIRV